MLTTLQINNFALIDSLEIEFTKGLNIITGETGAGKSIIVDALMVLLGERASPDLIREGENKAVIEGLFLLQKGHPVLDIIKENDIDSDKNELLLRRELLSKGTSRCFINDTPVQVNLLKKIGDNLVDFHGQHDHQLLLNKDVHIGILDIFADTKLLKKKYSIIYHELKDLINQYTILTDRENSSKTKEESLKFELKEITKVNPVADEDDLLEKELKIKENSELLYSQTSELLNILQNEESSVQKGIIQSIKILDNLKQIEPEFDIFYNECKTINVTLNEIIKFTSDYNSNIDFNSERLEEIRERLQALKGLKKRYGSIASALDRLEKLDKELLLIENLDVEIERIKNNIKNKKIELGSIALELSNKRHSGAKIFENKIVNTLKSLGVESAIFRVLINKEEIESGNSTLNKISVLINGKEYPAFFDGVDIIEFYISTNKGEIPKPLIQVASGGEISRIMLSIKSIVANSGELPILVFDEIDIGISGKIARKVGLTMKNLGLAHQIIAITHLPQIAALADRNISVKKIVKKDRTIVTALVLDMKDKVEEIAKLLSGEKITEISLKSAKELMNLEN
ncbi:MAG: DNA repair protein RecN [FCB group bacterium]|jgi:DNA repair protein RecN (Recombination protein N)